MSERGEYARDTVLAVRLSRTERSALTAEARRGGVPLSTYVRQSALLRADETPGLATRTAEVVYARHSHEPAAVQAVMGTSVATETAAAAPAQTISPERARGALLRQQLAGGRRDR